MFLVLNTFSEETFLLVEIVVTVKQPGLPNPGAGLFTVYYDVRSIGPLFRM